MALPLDRVHSTLPGVLQKSTVCCRQLYFSRRYSTIQLTPIHCIPRFPELISCQLAYRHSIRTMSFSIYGGGGDEGSGVYIPLYIEISRPFIEMGGESIDRRAGKITGSWPLAQLAIAL
jgi:hypothetical protein